MQSISRMLRIDLLQCSLTVSLSLAACAHAPSPPEHAASATQWQTEARFVTPATAPCSAAATLTPEQHIAQHGSVLDRYKIEGGVWLTHAPVLINRDFDFALAFAMDDGLGAGLAAAKRKAGNEKRAAELSDFRLPRVVEDKLAELRCGGTHVYFLLWEADKPVVRAVVDVVGEKAKSRVVDAERAEPLGEVVETLVTSIDSALETHGRI